MGTERNSHDDAIDKVLAAMREAAPPEGMDARIEQRLHRQASMPATLSRLPATSTLTGAWWRGAFSGAAAATLVAGVVLFTSYIFLARSSRSQTTGLASNRGGAAPAVVPVSASTGTPADEARAHPCFNGTVLRAHGSEPLPNAQLLRTDTRLESALPSHPAPQLELTLQERELVRLARTADPKVLASLNPETQARLDAEEEADFDKFFAPQPAPPSPPDSTPQTNNE
jgi:hypothetical protein